MTFCKASEHLKDEVIRHLCSEKNDVKNIKIKVKDTFILYEVEVTSLVEKFMEKCNFNPNTCELDGKSLLFDNQKEKGVGVY